MSAARFPARGDVAGRSVALGWYGFSSARGGVDDTTNAEGNQPSGFRARGCRCLPFCIVFPGRVSRARGGVAIALGIISILLAVFPRARGCCTGIVICSWILLGFPACAGVSLAWPTKGFPAYAGGVAHTANICLQVLTVSPRTRGCCFLPSKVTRGTTGFPACAGVLPGGGRAGPGAAGFPRVRGGVAPSARPSGGATTVSPCARGCCRVGYGDFTALPGFPACAGVSNSCLQSALIGCNRT